MVSVLGDRIESFLGDRRIDRRVRIRWLENGRRSGELVRFGSFGCGQLYLRKRVVQFLDRLCFHAAASSAMTLPERFGAAKTSLGNGWVLIRCTVGLREGRLVAFIVAVSAVTVDVHHHVATELVPEFQCDLAPSP